MKIEFGDLRFDERTSKHLEECVKTNWVSEGNKVKEFEENFGNLFGYKHNISMSSGTSADIAACMTLYDFGAERNEEIIVPALAFAATGSSILAAGFIPKFVDVERKTLNINPHKIREAINEKTKAIMAVHTMGKPCDMNSIKEIARVNNLFIIEDSCEAHGAKYDGEFIGNFGDMATFSFYAAHLICSVEGGMVSTNNDKLADLLRSIKSHGRKPGSIYFDHERLGLNFKTSDLHASIGLPQIEDFQKTFDIRRENLSYLLEKTNDLSEFAWFGPRDSDFETVAPHAFSITLKDPRFNYKGLYEFLEDNSVKCKRNFGSMPTQHEAFKFLGHELGEFPEAEYIGDNGLHFGIHQYLSKDDLSYVSGLLHKYFGKFK